MCNNLYIIDDDPLSHFILNKLIDCNNLTKHHSNYTDARNALADLTEEEQPLPDAIFLDINMEEMDGWGFLDELGKTSVAKNIPVYIISSSLDQRDKIHSEQYDSVKGFFSKPISVNNLKSVLCQMDAQS